MALHCTRPACGTTVTTAGYCSPLCRRIAHGVEALPPSRGNVHMATATAVVPFAFDWLDVRARTP